MLYDRILGVLSVHLPYHHGRVESLLANKFPDEDSRKDNHAVRVFVNQYFRGCIQSNDMRSVETRLCLDDDDNLEYWFQNFRRNVVVALQKPCATTAVS